MFLNEKDFRKGCACVSSLMTPQEAASLLDPRLLAVQLQRIEMSYKMAELDRYPGHRMEDGGARKRGGILRSTHGTLIISELKRCVWTVTSRDEWTDICCDDGHLLVEGQKHNPCWTSCWSLGGTP